MALVDLQPFVFFHLCFLLSTSHTVTPPSRCTLLWEKVQFVILISTHTPPPGHGVAARCTQTHTHTTSLEDGPASEWEEQTVKVVPLRGRNCTTYYVERPLPLAN